MSNCDCAQCGEKFTSLTAFDRHQDVDYKRKPIVVCRPPADAGLVRGDDGRWRAPLSAAGAERLRKLTAERASAGTSVRV